MNRKRVTATAGMILALIGGTVAAAPAAVAARPNPVTDVRVANDTRVEIGGSIDDVFNYTGTVERFVGIYYDVVEVSLWGYSVRSKIKVDVFFDGNLVNTQTGTDLGFGAHFHYLTVNGKDKVAVFVNFTVTTLDGQVHTGTVKPFAI